MSTHDLSETQHSDLNSADSGDIHEPITPCFVYPGGKREIASMVWERFGDVQNYVEPFAGSLAVMLGRPFRVRTETINDANPYITNFFRAVKHEPKAVAFWADNTVNHADLLSRHRFLKGIAPIPEVPPEFDTPELRAAYIAGYQARADKPLDLAEFIHRMKSEPDYYDVKAAGWWVWGMACYIGTGWCDLGGSTHNKTPDLRSNRGVLSDGISQQVPLLRDNGSQGINSIHNKRPQLHNSHGVVSIPSLYDYMERLSKRLDKVRVVCGDWKQVLGATATYKSSGITAIFLDPPYSNAVRDNQLYAVDDDKEQVPTSQLVREWCLEHIVDQNARSGVVHYEGVRYLHPKLRIAICGYVGEGHEVLGELGWEKVEWTARGGMGNQRKNGRNENGRKEVIYFSPHCLKPEKIQQLTIF